jgi:uncharacterized protein (TIGR02145 family)
MFRHIVFLVFSLLLLSCNKESYIPIVSDPLPEADKRQKNSCGADSVHNPEKSYGSVKDHEGNSYKTIVIENQEWMAENLQVSTYLNGEKITESSNDWQSATDGRTTYSFGEQKYLCPFGRLYNWYAVTDPRNLCPTGWKIPSEADFSVLSASAGSSPIAALLTTGSLYWKNTTWTEHTNSTGFSGLPAGYLAGSGFLGQNSGFYLWSSTPAPFTGKLAQLTFSYQISMISQSQGGYYAFYGASVRCLKSKEPQLTTTNVGSITSNTASSGGNISTDGGADITARGICWSTSQNPTITLVTKTSNGSGIGSFSSNLTGLTANTTYYIRAYATNSSGTFYGNQISFKSGTSGGVGGQTVTDIDGNVYQTVTIGSQVWMKENLKVSRYRNGNAIPTNLSDAAWQSSTAGAYAIYNNDFSNNTTYGKLYNWYAVADSRGLCPVGWHVPSDPECTTLENYLGGISVAGGKMKALSNLWSSPNTDATNSSGFSGLPGGVRIFDGQFADFGNFGYFWSSTSFSTSTTWRRRMDYNNGVVDRGDRDKRNGNSVRCLKD